MSYPSMPQFTVPSKSIKKADGYPDMEDEKTGIIVNQFKCKMCKMEFKASDSDPACPRCLSKSIEKNFDPKKVTAVKKENLKGFFSRFVKDAADQFGEIMENVGGAMTDTVKTFGEIGDEIKPTVKRTISELASVKDIVLYRTRRNRDGQTREVEVRLDDAFRNLFIKFGLVDKKNPQFPANDKDLQSLEEIKITEDDYKLNDTTNEYEPPECSICICDIEGKGIKTDCGHYFHKDCLFPWLHIHNRCPFCCQTVAK